MSMFNRRLQVLIDDERLRRVEAEAARRGVSVAVVVRDALDAAYPSTTEERQAAAQRILAAEPMPVGDVEDLRAELDAARGRHG